MTLHAQPLIPFVGPFVGDVPEDRHAERVVQMMRDFLGGADEAGPAAARRGDGNADRVLVKSAAAIPRTDRRRPLAAAHPLRDRDGLRGDHERREPRAYRCLRSWRASGVNARLDDRIGVATVTYLLFGVKLGPGLTLFLVLVFAIWIGWRWLCRKCPAAWAVRNAWPHAGCRYGTRLAGISSPLARTGKHARPSSAMA
jgi:hypothetical protein